MISSQRTELNTRQPERSPALLATAPAVLASQPPNPTPLIFSPAFDRRVRAHELPLDAHSSLAEESTEYSALAREILTSASPIKPHAQMFALPPVL